MADRLSKVYETTLNSTDGCDWRYIVKVHEDVTNIFYQEGEEKPEHLGTLTAGFDIQVAEEIIRLRKLKQEEDEL